MQNEVMELVAANKHIRPHADEYRRFCEVAPRMQFTKLTGLLAEAMIAALEEAALTAQPAGDAAARCAGIEADMNGFIPTKAWREGEFTTPLYLHALRNNEHTQGE